MLLVLGRPGSGCSTFLKVIGNQRSGYESVEGDVRYGGTDSTAMAKNYRSEGIFPEKHEVRHCSDSKKFFTTRRTIFTTPR
jgi:ABC-type multidrug transport system ATPase subunit